MNKSPILRNTTLGDDKQQTAASRYVLKTPHTIIKHCASWEKHVYAGPPTSWLQSWTTSVRPVILPQNTQTLRLQRLSLQVTSLVFLFTWDFPPVTESHVLYLDIVSLALTISHITEGLWDNSKRWILVIQCILLVLNGLPIMFSMW